MGASSTLEAQNPKSLSGFMLALLAGFMLPGLLRRALCSSHSSLTAQVSGSADSKT
jgi:hypothetical protein